MILGIFGKSGSGKSTVCKYLSQLGFYIIDADIIGHNILKKGNCGYEAVVNSFGKSFLNKDSEIDRKKLGKYVFENNKAELLSSITHPLIDREVKKELEKPFFNFAIDGALIHTTDIKNMCDKLILIKSDDCESRIVSRDDITKDMAQKRLNSQDIPDCWDIVIENNGSLDELYNKMDKLLKGLKI